MLALRFCFRCRCSHSVCYPATGPNDSYRPNWYHLDDRLRVTPHVIGGLQKLRMEAGPSEELLAPHKERRDAYKTDRQKEGKSGSSRAGTRPTREGVPSSTCVVGGASSDQRTHEPPDHEHPDHGRWTPTPLRRVRRRPARLSVQVAHRRPGRRVPVRWSCVPFL